MNIQINIECNTISEFHSHLTVIQKQIKRSARKQKLDPLKDEFAPEDADKFYDDNCYGTHDLKILTENVAELRDEAKELVKKLLPGERFGESYEAERLYLIVSELL